MATRNEVLRQLHCGRECKEPNKQQPEPGLVAEAERHSSCKKDQKVFEIVCNTGDRP